MMKVEITSETELHEKCQCITLDESGAITGSCDTLFATSKLSADAFRKEFPFLWKVISYLKNHDEEIDPLFFPTVDFEWNGYRSICDFTVMKSVDALGIKRFIWMIYDNSIHYRDLIQSGYRNKIRKPKFQF